MPMIDVYAARGTFDNHHDLAQQLAAAVMRWEQVPRIALFENNTAAFIHELAPDSVSNVAGQSNYVRVQVLTPAGVLDLDKQLGVVRELSDIVAAQSTGMPAPALTSPPRSAASLPGASQAAVINGSAAPQGRATSAIPASSTSPNSTC